MTTKFSLIIVSVFLLFNSSLVSQSFNSDLLEATNLIDKIQYLDSKTASNYNVDVLCPKNVRTTTNKDQKIASDINLGCISCSDKYTISVLSNDSPKNFEVGNTVVTWKLKMKNGKKLSCNQTVRVKDIEMPTITCPINVRAKIKTDKIESSRVSLGTLNYSDNCGIANISNDAPREFLNGNTVVTWTVTDLSGNTSTCNQSIRITNEKTNINITKK